MIIINLKNLKNKITVDNIKFLVHNYITITRYMNITKNGGIMKSISKIALALILTLATSSQAMNVMAADTIKIGVMTPLSGEFAGYGIPTLRAAELIADEYNAKGGINGKKIEIIAADDQCKPELAPNAATSLLSQNIVAAVGTICSGGTKAALPIFTEAKIVLISPASTTPDLTLDGKSPYFFRTIGHDFSQAEIATEFLGKELKAKKVAFLNDKSEYGLSYTSVTRDNIKKKYPEIEVVLFEAVTSGAPDYSAAVRKLARAGAQAVVWGGYHNDAANLANNLKDLGHDIPIIGPDSLKENAYLEAAGSAAENTFASAPSDTSANPLSKKAAAAHVKKYGSAPGVFFDNGYAAVLAIVSAIEKTKSTESDKIVQQLHNVKVDTPLGSINFDKNGDAIGIGMSMYKVEKGKYIPAFNQ